MAQVSYPFDSTEGITEADWTEMAQHWVDTGVIPKMLNELKVYADSSGMQVKVNSGVAFIKGNYYKSDAEEILAVGASDSTNPRIDRVILRVDWFENTTRLYILQGTAAVNPVAPALTQNSGRWEISLAQVRVETGALTIAADKITDERYMVEKFENRLVANAVINSTGIRSVLFDNLPSYINEYRLLGSFRNASSSIADLRLFLNTGLSAEMAGARLEQNAGSLTAASTSSVAATIPVNSYSYFIDASIIFDKRSKVPFIIANITDGYDRAFRYTGRGTLATFDHLKSLRITLVDQDYPTSSWFSLYRV